MHCLFSAQTEWHKLNVLQAVFCLLHANDVERVGWYLNYGTVL